MHKQRPSFSRNCQILSQKETPFVKTSMGSSLRRSIYC